MTFSCSKYSLQLSVDIPPVHKNLTSGNTDAKAWKDIWGSGQGIGGIKDDPSVEDLVTRLKEEYNQAKIEFNGK